MADCSNGDGRPARAAGLCAACYQRQRRATPRERQRLTGETETLAPLVVPAGWKRRVERAAEQCEMTSAAWLRELIKAHLPDEK